MVAHSKQDRLTKQVPAALVELIGVKPNDVEVRADVPSGADFVVSGAGKTFVIRFSKSTGAAPIAAAAKQLQEAAQRIRRRVVPLLAVPYMGEIGRKLCKEAGLNWIDLSGNGHIVVPGLRVIASGQPNLFLSAGRPPNLFAPKSSRVARWLLIHSNDAVTQRQIAEATDMTEGFVSRIVSRLETEGYIERLSASGKRNSGAGRPPLRVRDPALLLEAWRAAYQFSKHTLIQGHVTTRSGDALLRFVSETLREQNADYAATGLAAAWALTHFAAFRIATVYLPTDPSSALLRRLSFREDPRGANLWLVVPSDAGVFHGASEKDSICCVHPVQAYVDLKAHPERAADAAQHLRSELLDWEDHD